MKFSNWETSKIQFMCLFLEINLWSLVTYFKLSVLTTAEWNCKGVKIIIQLWTKEVKNPVWVSTMSSEVSLFL